MTYKKLSISKVFWNTATPTCLCIIYGYFCAIMVKLRSCLKIFAGWLFMGKDCQSQV